MGNVTCEEYVVNKVMALEKENENLKENLQALSEDCRVLSNKLMKIKSILNSNVSFKVRDDNDRVVNFDGFYDWNVKENVDFLVDFLDLGETEEEDG